MPLTKQELEVVNQTNFPNNTTGYISPSLLREFNTDVIDNTVNQTVYNTNSASVNARLVQQETFSSSIMIDYINQTELNSATASLSASLAPNINNKTLSSSFNSFTQSTDGRLTTIETNYASKNLINTFTQDQNFQYDVYVNSDLNVAGNLSVTGAFDIENLFVSTSTTLGSGIWSTTILRGFVTFADPREVYFGDVRWNVYTQSVEDRITVLQSTASLYVPFSTSVNSRIVALTDWSSSLTTTFATDDELNNSSSILQTNINKKLDTASFSSYSASVYTESIILSQSFSSSLSLVSQSINPSITALSSSVSGTINILSTSVNSRLDTIEVRYATTGSNLFTGTQTITGSSNKLLIGDYASTTTYPAATVIVSNVSSSDVENHNIGIVGAGLANVGGTDTTGWGVGGYFKGWTNGAVRSAGVIGEGMVNLTTDGGSSIGVRGYSQQTHSGGTNIGLYGDAVSGSTNYALYMNRGDIASATPQIWALPTSSTALNIGGLINFDTVTNNVTISGSFNGFGQTISGSSVGNVVPAPVVTGSVPSGSEGSATSSIDMSKGNFFTIIIPSSSVTLIKATNINAGQTVAIRLIQQSPNTGSVIFDTPYKFWSGSANVNTGSAIPGAVDIVTFISFDTASLYTSMIRNLV